MSYLYVSKKKHAKHFQGMWIAVAGLVVVLALLILWRLSIFSLLTSIWKGEESFIQSASVAGSWFSDKTRLAAEISELREANEGLKARLSELEAIALLYQDLTTELGTSTAAEQGILSKVIRRPPFTVFDTYVIDKGNVDGIETGDRAYAHGLPVGTVQSVTERNAIVKLYSSPSEKLLVTFGTTSMQYEASGIGNGALKADIPRDAMITEGMAVTADDRSVTVFGAVKAVERQANGTSKTAFISLPFDVSGTGWLVIRKDGR